MAAGLSAEVKVTYVGGDDFVQVSTEVVPDGIITLGQVRTETKPVFSLLSAGVRDLPQHFLRRSETVPADPLPEFWPAYTMVWAGGGKVGGYHWGGLAEDVPEPLAEVLQAVRALGETADPVEFEAGALFVRAGLLDGRTRDEYRRAGLFAEIDEGQLRDSPALLGAVGHPFRLIRLDGGAESLGTFRDKLIPGRSTLELYGASGEALQVRCLEAVGK